MNKVNILAFFFFLLVSNHARCPNLGSHVYSSSDLALNCMANQSSLRVLCSNGVYSLIIVPADTKTLLYLQI